MKIEAAKISDVPETAAMLADAFASDPNATYLFAGTPEERRPFVMEFFGILMTVRVACAMPVFVLRDGGRIGGMVMGYDVSRPEWPDLEAARWEALQARRDGAAVRFAKHDAIVERFSPQVPQYYLGVLGVHPSLQGLGAGTRLLSHFCKLSDADPDSAGISIETANPRNASYYETFGFERMAEEELDASTRLHVLFRPRA